MPSVGWRASQPTDPPGSVRVIAPSKERLYVGGDFYSVGTAAQTGIAWFNTPGLLTEPTDGMRTEKRLAVKAKVQDSAYNQVRLEFRLSTEESRQTVPSANVTDDQTGSIGDCT